ncbi:MAG: precorrin-6y C5,15-methyltransferase (decarboxylating) subunit CbiE, partial [Pseudomonadota bacterium]
MALDVVSLGTALTVPDSARDALAAANLIVGAQRHLDAIDSSGADTLIYPSPISELAAVIDANRERNLVVLASGDALFYGIGSFVLRHCGANKPRFHPNVTTLQSACARAGRTWQDIKVLSLHGRPLSRLRACLQAGVALAIFTDSTNAPSLIASELVECAFSDSSIAVVEALDTTRERIRSFSAGELAQSRDEFDSLNLLIVDVAGEGGLLPAFPGIDDAKFAEGGDTQFTKREVRLAALSRLQ